MTAIAVSWPSRKFVNQERHWRVFATSARCDSIAPFETPVVPPVYWSTARSAGRVPMSKCSAGAPCTRANATAPGSPANGWRCPSFRSLATVKSTRSSGGISSLMFVTMTCSTLVPARAAFTTGYSRESTTTTLAPESVSWCPSSGAV